MEQQNNSIVSGVIWKQILRFFFPILIGTFFQQLYNTVDTVIIGQYVGTNALASVGTTNTFIRLLLGFFVGVSSGAAVIIAQYYGANDGKNVSKSVHTSIALGIVGGVIIMVIGLVCSRPVLQLMNVRSDILDDAVLYMNVYFMGIIGNMVYNVGTGILRAIGDSKTPLYVLIVCSLANVVLDLLFVLVFRWAVFGVAFATILSQLISAILVMARLMRATDTYRVQLKKIRFDPMILKRIIRIGLPTGLQSVMYSFSNLLIQATINGFDTYTIASWAALEKVDGIIWMVMNAFGITVTTFVGQNFGARQYDRMRKCTRVGLLMALGTTISLSTILYFFRVPILSFFTGDSMVVNIGARFFAIMAPTYFTFVFIEVFSATIRGAGEAVQPMLIDCVGVCSMRILWLLIVVPRVHTIEMVAWNYPVSWVITALVFIVYYLRGNWLDRCIRRTHDPEHTTLKKLKTA